MELQSGFDAEHKMDKSRGYALCGVDSYNNNDDWSDVNCWECRALADHWEGVTDEEMGITGDEVISEASIWAPWYNLGGTT